METERRHKLEIATLKRQLKRAQRHIAMLEETAHLRRRAYINIRDDVFHFCQQWLECLSLIKNDWRSRSLAQKLWFTYCMDIFPASEDELMEKMGQLRLFENGEIPEIKNPPETT